MTEGTAALGALILALVATPLAIVVARRVGAVDHPGPLKPQERPVPYLGGVAVFLATTPWVVHLRPTLLAPLALCMGVGLADDLVELRPWHRLVGQLVAGAGIAALVTTRIPQPAGGILVVAVTVLLANGVNLVDGLDGLASGVAGAACAGFAVLLVGSPRLLALSGLGALVGFLVFNRPPARVYLGDAGSSYLGALSTVLLASSWASGLRLSTAVAALLLVAVPSTEVAVALVRRLRSGGSVVTGDRRHPYDLLVRGGWRPGTSTLAYVGAAVVLGAVAVAVAASHSVGVAVAGALLGAAALLIAAGAIGALHGERSVST